MGGPPAWGLGEMLTTPHRKNVLCLTDTLVQTKQRKGDMRIGSWNVRSLYRAGSLTAVARELWIFRKWDVGAWTGSSRVRIGTGGGHL